MRSLIAFFLIGCFLLAAGIPAGARPHCFLVTIPAPVKASQKISSATNDVTIHQEADLPAQNELMLIDEEDDDEESGRKSRAVFTPLSAFFCDYLITIPFQSANTTYTTRYLGYKVNSKFLSFRVLRI